MSLNGIAVAGAFEIDDVQEGNFAAPCPRARRRIVVIDGHVVVAALVQAHGLASEEVDRRDHDHDATNLSSSASPARWLFSG
jgi:hypothetical protein